MDVLQNSAVKSKSNGAAPPSRHHDPADVVSFPTALSHEQRRQQAVWRRHAGALSTFLERPTSENECRVRATGAAWIASYLGNGEEGQQAHHSLDKRIREVRLPVLVSRVHALGPRTTGEFLTEVAGNDAQLADDIFTLLERYAALTPAKVQAVGGDVYPPTRLHALPSPQGM